MDFIDILLEAKVRGGTSLVTQALNYKLNMEAGKRAWSEWSPLHAVDESSPTFGGGGGSDSTLGIFRLHNIILYTVSIFYCYFCDQSCLALVLVTSSSSKQVQYMYMYIAEVRAEGCHSCRLRWQ